MTHLHYEQHLGQKASKSSVPEHVAIIMDGNGRWASAQGQKRSKGHQQGKFAVQNIIGACLEKKIKVLTLFTFGLENWKRPASEVRHLFRLLFVVLHKELKTLLKEGVRLNVYGRRDNLPLGLTQAIVAAENETAHHDQLQLNLMFNYSGRWDIQQAIAQACAANPATACDAFQDYLSLASWPEPDLMIRTAGVQRLSNFILWELAYTELYFTPCFWPNFDANELDKAIAFYQAQERRFGLTSHQVEPSDA